MKTTTLTMAVLMALSFSAYSADELPADQAAPAKPAAAVAEAPKAKTAEERAKEAEAEAARAKKEAEEAKAETERLKKAAEAKAAEQGRGTRVKADENKSAEITHKGKRGTLTKVEGNDGETYARFTAPDCSTCTTVVVLDKESAKNIKGIEDLKNAFEKAFPKEEAKPDTSALADVERDLNRRTRDRDRDRSSSREDRIRIADIKKDFESDLSAVCDLSSNVAATSTASCLRDVIADRMESFDDTADAREDIAGLKEDEAALREKIREYKRAEREWENSIARETNATRKERMELRLKAIQTQISRMEDLVENKKEDIKTAQRELTRREREISAMKNAMESVAKDKVINPAIQKLVNSPTVGMNDLALHDLALNTPKEFGGIKQAAVTGLFDVVKAKEQARQANLQLAEQHKNNPAQSVYYMNLANQAGSSATAFHHLTFSSAVKSLANTSGGGGATALQDLYTAYAAQANQFAAGINQNGVNGTANGLPNAGDGRGGARVQNGANNGVNQVGQAPLPQGLNPQVFQPIQTGGTNGGPVITPLNGAQSGVQQPVIQQNGLVQPVNGVQQPIVRRRY